ncbi:hypothetical protein FJ948_05165 [Mesorhizobium sp. B2-3-12]|nr:hypothetical protein FJ948_05165 [Mesorhizobium sp. B2-3-12]
MRTKPVRILPERPLALWHTTLLKSVGSATLAERNQIGRRALLGMDGRKPYETPQWWPGSEGREAMCCSFCGGRDHRFEDCPQRPDPFRPDQPDGEATPRTSGR